MSEAGPKSPGVMSMSSFDSMAEINALKIRIKELTGELQDARTLASVQVKQATDAAETHHNINRHADDEPRGEATDTSFRVHLTKTRGSGFGFGFSTVALGLKVETLTADSPADNAGLKAGQIITEMMGRATADMAHEEAAEALRSVQWVVLVCCTNHGLQQRQLTVIGARSEEDAGDPASSQAARRPSAAESDPNPQPQPPTIIPPILEHHSHAPGSKFSSSATPPAAGNQRRRRSSWQKVQAVGHMLSATLSWSERLVKPQVAGLDFEVAADYDFTKSTNDNYKESDTSKLHGDFVEIRKHTDFSYHINYTKERQFWQDRVVKSVVYKTAPQATPWVVYTAGPMGAGKGYALQWMSDHGFFPLENIVHIDPDHFKSVMPEWDGYTKQSTGSAGTLCHRESGFIQEIAQEVAMKKMQNIWVDGSLKDGDWFSKVYSDIRERFPQYKIAIFYVYADEDIIRARVKSRELKTGRGVPEEELVASMKAPTETLAKLVHYVDFIARINNNSNVPYLSTFETVDSSGAWKKLQGRFARTQPDASEFPVSLAPLHLTPFTIPHDSFAWPEGLLEIVTKVGRTESHQIFFSKEQLTKEPLLTFRKFIKYPSVWISPAYIITLPADSRVEAGIPIEADRFVYCAGIEDDGCKLLHYKGRQIAGLDEDGDHIAHFALNGGFMYFDANLKVVGLACVRGMNSLKAAKKGINNILQFGPGQTVLEHAEMVAVKGLLGERLRQVSLPVLRKGGACCYAWLQPLETVGGILKCNRNGGFMYEFCPSTDLEVEKGQGHYRFFPVLGSGDV